MAIALADLTADVRQLNVTPVIAVFNFADARSRHAVLLGDDGHRATVGANGMNLFSVEKGVALRRALCLPVLRDHIGHVVIVCSKKQVVDVDTGPIVTPMADVQTGRDWAIPFRPSKTMGSPLFPLPVKHPVSELNNSGPKRAAALIGRRSVVRQPPRQRPVTGHREMFTSGFSHGMRFLRCCDQGRVGASTPRGPHTLAVAA